MTIQVPELGERFVSKVYFRLGGVTWTNSIQFEVTDDGADYVELLNASRAFADFCTRMTAGDVLIEKHVVSTMAVDDSKTHPFMSETVNKPAAVTSTEVLPLDQVLVLRKNMFFGRPGSINLRSTVLFSDVIVENGEFALNPTELSAYDTRLSEAMVYQDLSTLTFEQCFLPSADVRVVMVPRADATEDEKRFSTGLAVWGLASRQLNNRWYNRGTG